MPQHLSKLPHSISLVWSGYKTASSLFQVHSYICLILGFLATSFAGRYNCAEYIYIQDLVHPSLWILHTHPFCTCASLWPQHFTVQLFSAVRWNNTHKYNTRKPSVNQHKLSNNHIVLKKKGKQFLRLPNTQDMSYINQWQVLTSCTWAPDRWGTQLLPVRVLAYI